MTVNFIQSGQKTFVEKVPPGLRVEKLKAALYTIEHTREEGFHLLEIADEYSLPAKTYGNHHKAAERVINTHFNKKGNTGILLTGLKGTGKSLFVKIISNAMIKAGVPVIQINKAFAGDDLFNFVENIGNCALVFDEFGKNYSNYESSRGPSQAGLLSLFDGLTNSKRLHLFTENNLESISEYLINRPGRVHYHFKYNRLPLSVIAELCKDQGAPEEIIAEMKELSTRLKVLSFDVVMCMLNEWKLYGGKLEDHLDILNVSLCNNPAKEKPTIISITKMDGTIVPPESVTVSTRDDYIYIDYDTAKSGSYRDRGETFMTSQAIKIVEDIYHFLNADGAVFVIKIPT